MRIAVVATPQPMSRTRSFGPRRAQASNWSVEARPPEWITRLPSTARNAYGSRAWTCSADSRCVITASGNMFK